MDAHYIAHTFVNFDVGRQVWLLSSLELGRQLQPDTTDLSN